MKLVYRILILFAIFVASLIFFGQDMDEKIFSELDVVDMSESTLPVISFDVKDKEINLLYGYTTKMDPVILRETIVPVDTDKNINMMIYENKCVVRKLVYELYDINSGKLLEEGTISALTSMDDYKKANIVLSADMSEGKEYALRITLITDTSKRVYYYTRLKQYKGSRIGEAVDYAQWFHESLISKTNEADVKKRLESSPRSIDNNYGKVTIESSYDMVTYGDLEPKVIYELPVAVTEAYAYINTFVFRFVVSVDTGTGEEYYLVKECLRTRYTGNTKDLFVVLNYERSMEAIFDVQNTSLSKNQFKIGISAEPEADRMVSTSKAYTALRIGNEVFLYSKSDNALTRVFSFKEKTPDYMQELNDNHDIKLLSISEDGDIDFAVYGYMNRGTYEGRVAMILYTYHNDSKRVEEKAYFPMEVSYQILKEELGEFMWLNRYDILYFSFYDNIYSYNLSTEALEIVAEGIDPEILIVKESLGRVAWQNKDDLSGFTIFDPETGKKELVKAPDGDGIVLFDTIDDNLIYGYVKRDDITKKQNGVWLFPAYKLFITDFDQNILKTYGNSGYYVTDIEVNDNVIILKRVEKTSSFGNSYKVAEEDAIQNRKTTASGGIITSRLTEKMLTEYYISMPSGISFGTIPKLKQVKFITIERDTAVRIGRDIEDNERYYAYLYGEIIKASDKAVKAIEAADSSEYAGTVISATGRVVWERLNITDRVELRVSMITKASDSKTPLQATMQTFFDFIGKGVDGAMLDFSANSIISYIESNIRAEAVDLSGLSLEALAYYIYTGKPVIALTSENEAYLVCGYVRQTYAENGVAVTEITELTVVDANTGRKTVLGRDKALKLFGDNDFSFVCYAE